MKKLLTAASLAALIALPVQAQTLASAGDYRTCSPSLTTQGLDVVASECGRLAKPSIATSFNSLSELQAGLAARDAFRTEVTAYGQCVNGFINSYRRPGADANSTAPDQAACAHAWAEDAATQSVMEVGRACIEFSNRSMTDATIEPWSGSCYPNFGSENG